MRTSLVLITLAGAAGLGGPSGSRVAAAQPAPATAEASPRRAPDDPALGPGFLTLDRIDAASRIGVQISYLEPDTEDFIGDKPTLLRFAAHARYVHPSGIGGYAHVPFAYGTDDDAAVGSETITDFGNIEVGGIFAPRLSTPGLGVILHAGITLPTGETGVEGLFGTVANIIFLQDLYNSLPKGLTFKIGASPVIRSGMVFARFDLGLDVNIDAEDVVVGKGIHYNAGVGLDLGSAAITLESANLSLTNDSENSDRTGTTLNTLALGARVNAGAVLPYFAIVIPLDEDISETIDFAVTLGAEVRL